MTTARIARRLEPALRTAVDRLFLDGMDWTDAHPWFGFVGAAVSGLIFAVIKGAFL